MKKAILTLAVVALMCTTVLSKTDPAKKSTKSAISITPVEEGKFALNMSTADKGIVQLKITDQKGKLLISERVPYNKSFSLPIDMSYMKEGTYKVSAESEKSSLEQDIFVSQLYQEDVAAFITEKGTRKFQLKVFHEDVPVSIKIRDSSGNVYYSNTVKNEANFIQDFDLSKVNESTELELIISGKKSKIYKSI